MEWLNKRNYLFEQLSTFINFRLRDFVFEHEKSFARLICRLEHIGDDLLDECIILFAKCLLFKRFSELGFT